MIVNAGLPYGNANIRPATCVKFATSAILPAGCTAAINARTSAEIFS